MTTTDTEGRERLAVYLPPECWAWLGATAERDGTSRSDLLEGLVLLAMDGDDPPLPPGHIHRCRCGARWDEDA